MLHEIKVILILSYFQLKIVYKYIVTSNIRLFAAKSLTEEKANKNVFLVLKPILIGFGVWQSNFEYKMIWIYAFEAFLAWKFNQYLILIDKYAKIS